MATRRFPKGPQVIAVKTPEAEAQQATEEFAEAPDQPISDTNLARLKRALLWGDNLEVSVEHVLALIDEVGHLRTQVGEQPVASADETSDDYQSGYQACADDVRGWFEQSDGDFDFVLFKLDKADDA